MIGVSLADYPSLRSLRATSGRTAAGKAARAAAADRSRTSVSSPRGSTTRRTRKRWRRADLPLSLPEASPEGERIVMKHNATSWLSRWAVPLAAFGVVGAVAAHAGSVPIVAPPPGSATPAGPGVVTLLEARLTTLEKRSAADATRIQALETSVKNLESAAASKAKAQPTPAEQMRTMCMMACIVKCPDAPPGNAKMEAATQMCRVACVAKCP
jgi:hypothetical protein